MPRVTRISRSLALVSLLGASAHLMAMAHREPAT